MEVHGFISPTTIKVTIDGQEFFVPDVMENRERQLIALWEAEGNVIPPATVNTAPINSIISDRQFFQQLAVMGLIAEDDALAYVQTGTLPAAFLSFIEQLPANQRFDAKMKLTGANSFHRDNPLVAAFAGMYGMVSADVDNLWRAASTL